MPTKIKTGVKPVVTAENYVGIISKKKIDVAPVLARTGRVDFWQAGFRRASSCSGMNYVGVSEFAHGSNPVEAVQKLLEGDVVHPKAKAR